MTGGRDRRPSPSPPPVRPAPFSDLGWRIGRRVGPRETDLLVRLVPGRVRAAVGPRLAALGIDPRLAAAAWRRVRRAGDWSEAWMWAAQRALGDAREAAAGGDPRGVAEGKRQAALAFHVATWPPPDGRALRTLRASVAALFAETLPDLDPGVRRLEVPWRAWRLPALLSVPAGPGPHPLVVLLNGATTAKEEAFAWRGPLAAAGFAVLALDQPGTGEAALHSGPTADCLDVLDGVVAVAAPDAAIDAGRIAIAGVSAGGALAVRIGQADRRVAAAVAVTPPFDAGAWLPWAGPVLRAHLAAHAGGRDRLAALAADLSLAHPAGRHRPPVLVFGAGADRIVPPFEAVRLAASLGDDATLVWRRDAGHAWFDHVAAWTADAAAWLRVVLDCESTRVDEPSPAQPSGVAAVASDPGHRSDR